MSRECGSQKDGGVQGMLQCPAEAKPQEWMAYTFPCSRSEQELLALMDIYEAFLAHLDTAQASAAARYLPVHALTSSVKTLKSALQIRQCAEAELPAPAHGVQHTAVWLRSNTDPCHLAWQSGPAVYLAGHIHAGSGCLLGSSEIKLHNRYQNARCHAWV